MCTLYVFVLHKNEFDDDRRRKNGARCNFSSILTLFSLQFSQSNKNKIYKNITHISIWVCVCVNFLRLKKFDRIKSRNLSPFCV